MHQLVGVMRLDGLLAPWRREKSVCVVESRNQGKLRVRDRGPRFSKHDDEPVRSARHHGLQLKGAATRDSMWCDDPIGGGWRWVCAAVWTSSALGLALGSASITRLPIRLHLLFRWPVLLAPRDFHRASIKAGIIVVVVVTVVVVCCHVCVIVVVRWRCSLNQIILPRVSKPKAEIGDGLVLLGPLEAVNGGCQAILLYAVVKGSVQELIRPQSQNAGDRRGGKHDGQVSCEAVEHKCRAGLAFCWRHLEFGRQMLQHVVPGVPWRARKQSSYLGGSFGSSWGYDQYCPGPRVSNGDKLTLAVGPPAVDAGARHQHIVDNREAALAVHPPPVPRENLHIMKHGSLVEPDTSAVDRAGELDLGWVEVVKRGLVQNLGRLIAEDVDNRLRGKQDVGIGREVCGGESRSAPISGLGVRHRLIYSLWMVINV